MNLPSRHNAMATVKPQSKAAISVAMKIILNKKNDEKIHFPACIAISK